MWPFNSQDSPMPKAIDSFLSLKASNTRRNYRAILGEFSEHLRGVPVEKAKALNVLSFVDSQKSRLGINGEISPQTIRRKVVALSSIYDWLVSQDLISLNPCKKILANLPRQETGGIRPTGVLTTDGVRKLLDAPSRASAAGLRDRALFALLFGGGLRISEACELLIGDIKTTTKRSQYLNLRRTKSQSPQRAVLPDWVFPYVKEYLDLRLTGGAKETDWFLASFWREDMKPQPLCTRSARRIFKWWLKELRLPENLSTHSARATAITRLLESGVSYREVQEFSRHSSIQMVERYDKRRWEIDESPAKKLKY